MDTHSLLLALLLQEKLPQGAVTGQLDIHFHIFNKTFWSFRCGWFCFVLLFLKHHECKISILQKICQSSQAKTAKK